jgi:hypothetical protein
MELLPPVGWADVATKHDLQGFESRFEVGFAAIGSRFAELDTRFDLVDARFDMVERRLTALEGRMDALDGRMGRIESELRAQTWKLMTLMVGVVGVVVAAVRL